VLTGRGALTRPWLFEEWRTKQELFPTAAERVGIFRCGLALAACTWSTLSFDHLPCDGILCCKLAGTVTVCRQLVCHMKEYLGDDDLVSWRRSSCLRCSAMHWLEHYMLSPKCE
jgi:hypothetical protein